MSTPPLNSSKPASPVVAAAAALPPSPPLSSHADEPSPAVVRALGLVRQLHQGRADHPWQKLALRRDEYRALQCRIAQDGALAAFVLHKARLDYDADARELVLRMPSALHEAFCSSAVARIKAQLARLADIHPSLCRPVADVLSLGSRTIRLEKSDDDEEDIGDEDGDGDGEERTQRSPDFQFHYRGDRWPCVVLEVSYSQKRKDLPRIAYDYIRRSNGNIGVVIGLDVDYAAPRQQPASKEAAIFVWREDRGADDDGVEYRDVVAHQQTLREPDGSPASGALELRLSDFLPPRALEGLPGADAAALPIAVPLADLCADLADAEQLHRDLDAGIGAVNRPSGGRWRKRKATPPEELSDGTEHKFRRLEEHESRRLESRDGSFSPLPQDRRAFPIRRRSSARLRARRRSVGG